MDGGDQIYQGPDGTALRFFTQPTKNGFQSEKHGRPIYDTSLMVEVMVPGSRESQPQFDVERTYCEEVGLDAQGNRLFERSPKYDEYRTQIEAYKAQSGDGLTGGTPLAQWAQIDAGTAATLRAVGIHSVEQLAGVHDGNLANLGMGGRVLREQAAAFLNSRQFGVPSAQMAAENANLKTTVETLTGQVQALTAQIAALAAQAEASTPAPAPAVPVNTVPAPVAPVDTALFTPPAPTVDTPPVAAPVDTALFAAPAPAPSVI